MLLDSSSDDSNELKKSHLAKEFSMGSMQNLPEEHDVWDKHSIKAAIARKGKNLSDLARDFDMPEPTLRSALAKPCKSGELVISQFLDLPLYVLFPERWTMDNKRIYPRYSKKQV